MRLPLTGGMEAAAAVLATGRVISMREALTCRTVISLLPSIMVVAWGGGAAGLADDAATLLLSR